MKKILIIQKRVGIGDFCVFLPPINEIAKFFNNHQIDILTQKRTQAKEFTFDHKYINEIFNKEICISPLKSLAVHITNVNSSYGLSPYINYMKLWEENENV